MPQKTTQVALPCSLALIAAFAILPAPTHADVRYTMEMKMGGAKADPDADAVAANASIRTTTYLKDMREREETAMDFGVMKMTATTITQCDKHQEIKLDPDLKIYTVSPIGAFTFSQEMASSPMALHKTDEQGADGGAGKQTVTFTAKDLGREKIADIDARHAMITFRTQSSGCAGVSDTTMKMEIWTGPIKAALNCPERYAESRVLPNNKGCQITHEMKGDLAGLRAMFGQMAVKQVFYDANDKPLFTRDLREHSTAALDDALFDVPGDYKKVSDDDFQKQEQQKMVRAFMPAGKAPGGAGEETPDAPKDANQTEPAKQEEKKEKRKKGLKIPGLPF